MNKKHIFFPDTKNQKNKVDRLPKNFFKNVSHGWNAYLFFHSDCNYNMVNNSVTELRNVLWDRIIRSLILAYSTTRADAI